MSDNIDFHGIKLEDAINQLEKIIDTVRLSNTEKEYHLIVGNGVIKNKFIEILKENKLEYSIPVYNTGTIIAFIS